MTYNVYAQNVSSKWTINFNYQNDSYLPPTGSDLSKAFGTSSFRGWTAGIDRSILQTKHFKLNAGISLNKKTHILTGSRLNPPFVEAQVKGLDHYYLTTPFTLQYTKSKIFQPSITINPGIRIFNRGEINEVTRFHRPPTGNFLQIMPGAEVRLSNRLKIFVGASMTRYDFFSPNIGKWAGGFQVGMKISLAKKKRTLTPSTFD
jgi:hypothetical protein